MSTLEDVIIDGIFGVSTVAGAALVGTAVLYPESLEGWYVPWGASVLICGVLSGTSLLALWARAGKSNLYKPPQDKQEYGKNQDAVD